MGPGPIWIGHCQQILTRYRSLLMTAPVPWSLAWSDNGDLAPQDQLDLLQCLVSCESASVQYGLIMAVEQLAVEHYSLLASVDVTSLCS